ALSLTWRGGRQLLRQGARGLVYSTTVGKALAVAQVALSAVLVMNAGLLIRTVQSLKSIDPAFSKQDVFVTFTYPRPDSLAQSKNDTYYPQLIERLKTAAGVQSASISQARPAASVAREEAVSSANEAQQESDWIAAPLTSISPG